VRPIDCPAHFVLHDIAETVNANPDTVRGSISCCFSTRVPAQVIIQFPEKLRAWLVD
jgi:hypothetical protein